MRFSVLLLLSIVSCVFLTSSVVEAAASSEEEYFEFDEPEAPAAAPNTNTRAPPPPPPGSDPDTHSSGADNDDDDDDEEVIVEEKATRPAAATPAAVAQELDNEDDEALFGRQKQQQQQQQQQSSSSSKQGRRGNGAASDAAGTLNVVRGLPAFTWQNWYPELFSLLGIAVFILNYVMGRSKNTAVATEWIKANHETLEENFAVVVEPESQALLVKDNASYFYNWATGRINCKSMTTSLDLLHRQDLLALFMTSFIWPTSDKVTFEVEMNDDAMDPFVVALGPKAKMTKLRQEMNDLNHLVTKGQGGEAYKLPASYTVLTDCPEVAHELISGEFVAFVNANPKVLESLHFTDYYSGRVDPDLPADQRPAPKKMLFLSFNLPASQSKMSTTVSYTRFVIKFIDTIARTRLSLQAKARAEKSRAEMQEELNKLLHQKRQEALQQRKEEKLRQERELMAKKDPETQRKYEEKERQKELKKRMNKVKAIMR